MSLITIFTSPKPFTHPHINVIQRNAIQSWAKLPDVDVLLMGDEEGMAEVAAEYGARHIVDVLSSENGLPLINGMFDRAREESEDPLLAYVNADIILLPDFVKAARRVAELEEKFLLVGRRWDLDVTEPIDFSQEYEDKLRKWVKGDGEQFILKASDFFVFPRELFTDVPDLLVGRAGWDNWMMYYATIQPWPAVDITADALCIHQNHDYAHLPNGQIHHSLEESQINMRLAGGWRNMYELVDVNLRLENGQLHPQKYSLIRWLHKLELFIGPSERQGWLWQLTRVVRRFRKKIMKYW